MDKLDQLLRKDYLRTLLDGFPATDEGYKRYFPPFVLISPAMQFLIEECGGKGFLDMVAVRQVGMHKDHPHQHWTFKRRIDGYVEICVQFFDEDSPICHQVVAIKDEFDLVFDSLTVHVGWLNETQMGICTLNEED